jgi:histidinol phosphatase-like enzyme (inositol monophosphatase family)
MLASVTPTADPELVEQATDMLREAGELTLRWFRSSTLEVERKGDGTPVTEADRAAERFLREEIERRFPDDAVIGEEEDDREGSSGRTWIIDPIDGTKAFTHGVPLYTNLLAVTDEHGPAIGVINVPALGEIVAAGRGRGCTCNGEPVSVSERTRLAGSYLSSSGFGYWPDDVLLRVKHADLQLRTWGDGYGYVLVATGRIDAMVDPEAAYWDLAPMPTVITEAGGRFTDWTGDPTARGGHGLATNGHLHDEVLALLRPPPT